MTGRLGVGLWVAAVTGVVTLLSPQPGLSIEPGTPITKESVLAPWVAAFRIGNTHQCTATLLERAWIVLSHHCAGNYCGEDDLETLKVTVEVGPIDAKAKEFTKIQQVHCLDASDKNAQALDLIDDLMLIRIRKKFGKDHKRPVLPAAKTSAPSSSDLPWDAAAGPAVTVGWMGKENVKLPIAHYLEMSPISRTDCLLLLANHDICPEELVLGETQFCARAKVTSSTANAGLLKGDSGGALVQLTGGRPVLIGVASKSCPGSGLAIYEDVSRHHDWIVEKACSYYRKKKWGKKAERNCRRRLVGKLPP